LSISADKAATGLWSRGRGSGWWANDRSRTEIQMKFAGVAGGEMENMAEIGKKLMMQAEEF
jgi:hypothetical protein